MHRRTLWSVPGDDFSLLKILAGVGGWSGSCSPSPIARRLVGCLWWRGRRADPGRARASGPPGGVRRLSTGDGAPGGEDATAGAAGGRRARRTGVVLALVLMLRPD